MYNTVMTTSKVVGLYYPDHGNIYNNVSTVSFSSEELNGYLPVLDLIRFNTDEVVKFGNGKNKSDEVVARSCNYTSGGLSQDIARRKIIDVTQNDLLVGPVTILLNFTDYNVTAIDHNEIRKTYRPLINTTFEEYSGKILIIKYYTLNSPLAISRYGKYENYLEALLEKFKSNTSSNIKEMLDIIKYVSKKWEGNRIAENRDTNTIKVATVTEVSDVELQDKESDGVYLLQHDLVLTLDDIVTAKQHPEITHSVMRDEELRTAIRQNSFTCYIVDNADEIADRYINVAGQVKKVPKYKNQQLISGLYMISVNGNGEQLSEEICPLNEIDSSSYVYKSIEEANYGANVAEKSKQALEEDRRTFERESMRLKSEFETNNLRLKSETDKIKAEAEQETIALRKELEQLRAINETERAKADQLKAKADAVAIEAKAKASAMADEAKAKADKAKAKAAAMADKAKAKAAKTKTNAEQHLADVKAKYERKSLAAKEKYERIKNSEELQLASVKRANDITRFDIDTRSQMYKSDYERDKYSRDSTIETLKTIGAIAGVAATGFLLYSKFSK